MADKWINTVEYGYFIDANSEVGYSYMGTDRVQCPHCKKKYPTVNYIVEANYCPNCGGKVNNKNQDGIALKLIPIKERNSVSRCWFCKTNKSVKYTGKVLNPCFTASNRYIDIVLCNKCAAIHRNDLID